MLVIVGLTEFFINFSVIYDGVFLQIRQILG
jgi:hypothetical protein